MKNRIIYKSKNNKYRIVEILNLITSLEDLKGDCYKSEVNPEIEKSELLRQESEFEKCVEVEGVYSYTLETWNSEPDTGWTHVDSCSGFVGQFQPQVEKFNHYIVAELKNQIPEGSQ